MTAPKPKLRGAISKAWIGALLTALLGLGLLQHLGDGLARLSYDLPFVFAPSRIPANLVMVYFDSQIKERLGQPADVPLARHFYTDLIERLTAGHARLALIDILFDTPDPEPGVDAALAAAMRKNGKVVLVGDFVPEMQGNTMTTTAVPPIPTLADAAAAWGLARVLPDPDLAIRRLDAGTPDIPSVGLAAASVDGAAPSPAPRAPDERWINYYCPPELLRSINLDQALGELPADYFKDCIVVVGVRPTVGKAGAERERFPTPYTRFGGNDASGPSIHAMSCLNFRRGDWINELPIGLQRALVVAWGVLIAFGLMSIRPWPAVGAAFGSSLIFAFAAIYTQMRWHLWFNWAAPAVAQTGFALIWAVGYQYLVENARRRILRNAFGAYLSPYMADRIANSEFSLALGGHEVEVTVMFTDLEGFTKMSETLAPAEVSRILTSYFNQTTTAILEQQGTIIKYIGDAVFAAWGAPLANPQHALNAVRAACAMSQASQREIEGRLLRTRIGVNTGLALAGNLGSDFRFDYTLIGDTVNFASRLEGLNKYLGTNVLISEATRRLVGDAIGVRYLGKFLVVGKSRPVGIYEALGAAASLGSPPPPWIAAFENALALFAKRQWDAAETAFRETSRLRAAPDGPSDFYLRQIDNLKSNLDPNWDGAVLLDSK